MTSSQGQVMMSNIRTFTTSRINKATNSNNAEDLNTLLEREIKEENEENDTLTMSQELSELQSQLSTDWTIMTGSSSTTNDGATVSMFKKEPLPNGAKISLSFHCQDTIDDAEEGGEGLADFFPGVSGGDGDEGGEEEEEQSPPIEFDVSIAKAGTTMKLSCTSENAKALIDNITIVPSDIANNSSNKESMLEDFYRGPVLEDLPEDVKEKLGRFLREDCCVDEDVSAFIAMYADYREQVEYVNWLEGVKKIVS